MPLPVSFFARQDSGSANNPALNLTGAPAIEITFVAETATGSPGDLFLDQPAGGGIDPDTQVAIGGVNYSFTYDLSGTLPTQKSDGSQQIPDQYEGSGVNVITVQDYPSAGQTMRFAFMPNESATQADMDAFGNGAIDVQDVNNSPAPTPICFVMGTLITTPRGEVAVEDLSAGDLVTTADAGAQPIRWISCTTHRWPGSPDKAKPILIPAGALGGGRPRRDLMVSPQHRMVIEGPQVEGMYNVPQVLAPAKGLTGLPGVRQMVGRRAVTYFHILLDHHSIVAAHGALSESFLPGPTAMTMLQAVQRDEIHRLFPALRADPQTGYGALARPGLSPRQAEALIGTMTRSNDAGIWMRQNSGRNCALAV